VVRVSALVAAPIAVDVPSATGASNVSGILAVAGVLLLLVSYCCLRIAVAGVPTVVNIPFTNGVPPILAFLLLLAAPDIQIASIAAVGRSVIVICTAVVSL
jgi:hypothetical protein